MELQKTAAIGTPVQPIVIRLRESGDNEAAEMLEELAAKTGSEVCVETDDWKLSCFLEWRPKSREEPCERCNGSGKVGGGFGDLDEARECDNCRGRRTVTKGPRTHRPEMPKRLTEYMRRAWWEFFNG